MSRSRLVAVAAVAVLAVVFLARRSFIPRATPAPDPTSSASSASQERADPATPATQVPPDEKILPDELPPGHDWGISPPTAAWMKAAANPVVVDPVVDQRRQAEKEVTAGGGIIKVGGERAQFTLYIPPGALVLNETVTLTVVQRVSGLPFARDAVSAVQISPASIAFLKPVSLTIEPRRRNARDPAPAVAGFAIRANREWHLYPAILSAEAINRFMQDRLQLVVTRAGIYGVAEATDEEVRTAAERLPSDVTARIEVEFATLMRGQAVARVAAAPAWTLLPIVHAQSDDPDRRELITRLVQRLREMYDQEVMPKLQKFRPDCRMMSLLESREIQREALSWIHSAQLLGLTSEQESPPPDPEMETLRETKPLNYRILERDRAANDAYYNPIIEEFDQRQARLWDAFWRSAQEMYAALVQCCKTEPHTWMPLQILRFEKLAEASGRADILGGGTLKDAQDCACAVSAVFHQEGWEGTISHKYSESGTTNQTRGSRTSTSSTRTDYAASIALMGVEDGHIVGFASAQGEDERSTEDVESGGACQVHQNGSTTKSSGRSVTQTRVTISFYQGRYNIRYTTPVAYGMERANSWYKAAGCIDPFMNRQYEDRSIRSAGITGGGSPGLEGKTDSQLVLKGSTLYTLPATATLQRRQMEVKWDLRACQAQ